MTRRRGIFFFLATDPPVRLWAGVGDRRLPADAVEPDETALYTGCGELLGIPEVQQLINGAAERIEFSLSGAGVTAQVAQLADEEADSVRYCEAWLGIRRFDDYDQPTGPTKWIWNGIADSTGSAWGGAGMAANRSISISVGTIFTFRQRPAPSYFTQADQHARSADDDFCNNASKYNAGSTKLWKPT